MSSTPSRPTPWSAVLASVLLVSAPFGPAIAQSTSGGLSTIVPTLRGGVGEEPPDTPSAMPASGDPLPALGSGAAPDPSASDPKPPPPVAVPNKFALPKSPARTADRAKIVRKGPPTLPPLLPYPTAVRLRGGVTSDRAASEPSLSPTVASLPVPTRPRVKIVDDGYGALGLRAGSFIVTPYVSQGFGYDSNPDQTQTGVKPSAFSRTEGGLGLASQWSSHALTADLHGGYNEYFSDPGANRPDATGTIDLRLDIGRDTLVDAEQRFSFATQRPGSPEVNVNTVTRPLVTTFGETLGATETFGRASIGLHGSFDRTAYDNALLSDGTVQDLANENYNDYGLRLRADYELTPVVKPFVDVLGDDRLHDSTVDLAGFRRDSVGIVAQGGSSFEFNRLFSGEISAGYGTRSYDDPRLRNLDGPVLNGSISYAVTPLTVLNLKAATTFDETTLAGSSGAQSRSATLTLTHQLLRNLTLTGAVSYLDTRYTGVPITETTLSETLSAEYHLSRMLVASASYNHQKLDSTSSGSSFSQDVVLIGLRLQR